MQPCSHAAMPPCRHAAMPPCINAATHQCINASMQPRINASMPQCIKPPNDLDLSTLCRIAVHELLHMLMQQECGLSRCRGSALAVDGDEILTNVCWSTPSGGVKHPGRTEAAEVTRVVQFVVDPASPVSLRQSQAKHVRWHSLPPFQP
jgi:hypothetical protein